MGRKSAALSAVAVLECHLALLGWPGFQESVDCWGSQFLSSDLLWIPLKSFTASFLNV